MRTSERASALEGAVEAIKEYIRSGNVPLGGKLATEAELGAMLGVGRSTVREAERVLQARGWITLLPGKGAFVSGMSDDDANVSATDLVCESNYSLRDMLDYLSLVEPYCARRCAEGMPPRELAALEQAMRNFEYASKSEDIMKLGLFEDAFRSQIVYAARNQLFAGIHGIITEALRRGAVTRPFALAAAPAAIERQRRVFEAISAREPAEAERAMIAYVEAYRAVYGDK